MINTEARDEISITDLMDVIDQYADACVEYARIPTSIRADLASELRASILRMLNEEKDARYALDPDMRHEVGADGCGCPITAVLRPNGSDVDGTDRTEHRSGCYELTGRTCRCGGHECPGSTP